MNVSRSGYYKWLKTKDILNNYEINRNDMCRLIEKYHKKHPSWGYRHINRQIRIDIGWYTSDNQLVDPTFIFNEDTTLTAAWTREYAAAIGNTYYYSGRPRGDLVRHPVFP